MTRPAVSVVMPFAGDRAAAVAALESLCALDAGSADELILADNSGTAPSTPGVNVVRATAERSPAHARNVGAEHAQRDWILFLDADCRAAEALLEAYFDEPIGDDVGALAGEVVARADAVSVAGRYGATRNFLSQEAHLRHPYRPRAAAANLLVRRAAFTALGGFQEGVRAAEDTDFTWRLQAAGWRLELRPRARVEHRYRTSLGELRRQWRGYAAGRAWLARRYDAFVPEPALKRGLVRMARRVRLGDGHDARDSGGAPGRGAVAGPGPRVGERGRFVVIDAVLAAEELAGFALSNRPRGRPRDPARVVLVADRFPERDDPLAELAAALEGARVEASARPAAPDLEIGRRVEVDYREDDGLAARGLSVLRLAVRHPQRCMLDALRRRADAPSLAALAPAVMRCKRDAGALVQPLGGPATHAIARRLAWLAGRRLAGQGRSP
ncbi:MAG: glycosyltransferase [Solirubrobacterales bacterium]|nr:glycosyltransferase [Solirubrobacterales bacterium]MBV9716536.1 glycosyltransferase [Solirubrobacterales bacterium]